MKTDTVFRVQSAGVHHDAYRRQDTNATMIGEKTLFLDVI
jgi:hypothetical protein